MSKLWGGRFEGGVDKLVEELGESVSSDCRLAPWDIRGSMAHARMLGRQGVLSAEDVTAILNGLESIGKDIEEGRFSWDPALEDVHTNIEAALVERIGDAGKRLHTGRSRNDQIALDTRLWLRDQLDGIDGALRDFQAALTSFGEAHIDVILPGCTHLQHAQPVRLAHHMLAYFEMFQRDRERMREVRRRTNRSPLGAAALAGTSYPIDPDSVAEELGFEGLCANSMDAVSDRDFLVEFCGACSLVMMHLSRLSEELILWSSPMYRYIEIGDTFTTGSSIMPQKKNPDVAELVRGKTGRVYGSMTALLTTLKGLPLAYNRDMQEDKEPAFDACDTVQVSLAAMSGLIPTITVDKERMASAVREGFLEATELADYLVEQGMPFREAHAVIGRIVLHCSKRDIRLGDLSHGDLQAFSSLFREDALRLLDPCVMVDRRDHPGGTARARVIEALENAKTLLRSY